MDHKWLVHIGPNRVLGPWSSQRVREALRKGEVDPFDKVSQIGSQIVKEILEVDEIFQPTDTKDLAPEKSPWAQHGSANDTYRMPNQGTPQQNFHQQPPGYYQQQAAIDYVNQNHQAQMEAQYLAEAKAKNHQAQMEAQYLAEAKAKIEMEAMLKAEAMAKLQAEANAKMQAEAIARMEAKIKAEAEANAKATAEAEAKIRMATEAQLKAEAEAKRLIEERAALKAEAEARRMIKEQAIRQAQVNAVQEKQPKLRTSAAGLPNNKQAAAHNAPLNGENQSSKEAFPPFVPPENALAIESHTLGEQKSPANNAETKKPKKRLQPKGMLALADPSYEDTQVVKPKKQGNIFSRKKTGPRPKQSAPNSKNFIAINAQGYIYGPLNTDDVIKNYKDGIFKDDFLIKDTSTNQQISIKHFLKSKNVKKRINANHGAVETFKKFEDFSPPSSSASERNSKIGIITLVVIAIIIGFMTLGESEDTKLDNHQRSSTKVTRSVTKENIKPNTKSPRPVQRAKATTPKTKKVRKNVTREITTKETTATKGPRRVIKKRTAAERNVYTGSATKRKIPFSQPKPAPQKTPVQAPLSSPVANLKGKDGQKVTIGPLSYLPAQLKNCGLKCELVMKDQTGTPITVKFFKGQFEQSLSRRAVNVTVSGRVSDNGRSLLLSSVK